MSLTHGAVGWSRSVIVAFPGHTHQCFFHDYVLVIPWLVRLYVEIVHEL